jgi:hypothetical protein
VPLTGKVEHFEAYGIITSIQFRRNEGKLSLMGLPVDSARPQGGLLHICPCGLLIEYAEKGKTPGHIRWRPLDTVQQ